MTRDGRLLLVPLTQEATYDQRTRWWTRVDLPVPAPPGPATPPGGRVSPRGRPPMSESSVIHDIGYQRYTGPRLGRAAVFGALYIHGLRAAYGFGRSAKAKIFPWLVSGSSPWWRSSSRPYDQMAPCH